MKSHDIFLQLNSGLLLFHLFFVVVAGKKKKNLVLNYSSSKNNNNKKTMQNISMPPTSKTAQQQVHHQIKYFVIVYNHIFPATRALLHSVHSYWCLLQHTLPHFTDFIVSTQPSPLQLPASNLPCIPLALCSSPSIVKLLLLWLKHPQM